MRTAGVIRKVEADPRTLPIRELEKLPIKKIASLLIDRDTRVRENASSALSFLSDYNKPNSTAPRCNYETRTIEELEEAVPALLNALRDYSAFVRGNAAEVLGRMGSSNLVRKNAFPLIDALKDDDPFVRGNAACALERLKSWTMKREIVQALIAACEIEKSDYARPSIVRALGGWQEAVPTLIDILNDTKEAKDVRKLAIWGLSKTDDDKVVPALTSALKDSKEEVRETAIKALWEMGPRAKDAASALLEVVANETEKSHLRKAAHVAIGKILRVGN